MPAPIEITPQLLRKVGARCSPADLIMHASALEMARRDSTVNNRRRLANFLGQIMVESAYLSALEESFAYRDPDRLDALFLNVKGRDHAARLIAAGPVAIANCVYANRMGNRDEASGDGWRYRGGGYKQLTAHDNYLKFGVMVHVNLIADPDQARKPLPAARLAFAYWDATNCSAMADEGNVEGITRAVNGPAVLALADRRKCTDVGLQVIAA